MLTEQPRRSGQHYRQRNGSLPDSKYLQSEDFLKSGLPRRNDAARRAKGQEGMSYTSTTLERQGLLPWPVCPSRLQNKQESNAFNRPRYVPRASCIATGIVVPKAEQACESEAEELAKPIQPDNWPLPALETSQNTTAMRPRLTSETQRRPSAPIMRVPSGRRPQRHVKQSASCGSHSAFTGSFQAPRTAPSIPHHSPKPSLTSSPQHLHVTAAQEQERARAHTLHGQTGPAFFVGFVQQMKRAYSLNDAKRRPQPHAPLQIASQAPRPRARASIRASLNKDLPPLLPDVEEAVSDSSTCLTSMQDSEESDVSQQSLDCISPGPQLPVLEIDSFLQDLTLANDSFYESWDLEMSSRGHEVLALSPCRESEAD